MGPCAISVINRWSNSHPGCDGIYRRAKDDQAYLTKIKNAAPIRQICGSSTPRYHWAVYVRPKADETERCRPQHMCGME